jgi:hypothetical protein
VIDSSWQEKLAPLVERDLFIREALLKRRVLSDTYHPELEKVHTENARKLQKLIDKKSFPTLSNAGEKGVGQSWLIILHAISLPDFMRECLTEIRLAAAANDYPLDLLASLEDRIAVLEGRPQIYGTHRDWIKGELIPTPIEDPDLVNARRQGLGLPPMDPSPLITDDLPPKDPEKKAREYEEWLKRVGWRS